MWAFASIWRITLGRILAAVVREAALYINGMGVVPFDQVVVTAHGAN
jgi:hypothetical protein